MLIYKGSLFRIMELDFELTFDGGNLNSVCRAIGILYSSPQAIRYTGSAAEFATPDTRTYEGRGGRM